MWANFFFFYSGHSQPKNGAAAASMVATKPAVVRMREDPLVMGMPSMYMPIKALNTFSRDWKIQARVASKSEKRMTRNGGSLLKIELVDMYGT